MPNLNLPTNITPGVTATFEADVESAWTELNRLSRDTGLRDITTSLINGWVAQSVRIYRIMDRTFWEIFNLDGSAATSTTMINLTDSGLTGFRPSAITESQPLRDDNNEFTGYLRATPTTFLCPVGFKSPASTLITFEHRCNFPWPNPLPGVAV